MSTIRSLLYATLAIVAGCGTTRVHGTAPRPAATPRATTRANATPAATTATAPAFREPGAPRVAGGHITELHVVDDARFWVVADARAWETRDGGRSFVDRTPFERRSGAGAEGDGVWSLVASPTRVSLLRGESEPDAGVAVSMKLYVSDDGGDTFVSRDVPLLSGGRTASLQEGPDPRSLLVLRTDGGGMNSHATNLLETRDAGATFRELGTVTGYGGVTFQTPTSWWSVGSCCASASSVYRSRDGGRAWREVEAPAEDRELLSSVVFVDAARAYRVARDGDGSTLERSTDGGRSFARVRTPANVGPASIDRDACALRGEGAGLVVTRDMGASWTSLPPLPSGLAADQSARLPHGWLATAVTGEAANLLYVLRDGAAAWEELWPRASR